MYSDPLLMRPFHPKSIVPVTRGDHRPTSGIDRWLTEEIRPTAINVVLETQTGVGKWYPLEDAFYVPSVGRVSTADCWAQIPPNWKPPFKALPYNWRGSELLR
jgi:hypothetical protein